MQQIRDSLRRGFSEQMIRDALNYYHGGQISWHVDVRNRSDNSIRQAIGRKEDTAAEWNAGDNMTGITVVGNTVTRT